MFKKPLHHRAYAAIDRGDLREAARLFDTLIERSPKNTAYRYMAGLASKYLRDWPTSLRHNLDAIALSEEIDEAAHWNAAIAAIALQDWATARRLWEACGIRVPEGEGPIVHDYGLAVARLHPWHGGETLWMQRIDPVRGRLLNVPLPESGHRYGDIVLHDGASTGHRSSGGHDYPVFNALERVIPSDFRTFVVFVRCRAEADIAALSGASAPGLGLLEDWTSNLVNYCMRCSYGTPHRDAEMHDRAHEGDDDGQGWMQERTLGIAAQSRQTVDHLLDAWRQGGRDREVDAIESRECEVPAQSTDHVWWRGPGDDE
ncbi:tetratricopeptide repeat protein [Lysobacter brunescens]|uniref:Tetratricopeptide repeat protein n=1 Tax=Lysobacter brunescens TaxID=262323 RepID=A0ABW2Y6U5_9GAMM